jgi:exopolyphosphatase / guanosine-5'-triphosphate,3'-diphosphate pyrophosphatase
MERAAVRAAAVDIGSNTVRLLVAEVNAGEIVEVDRALEVVGLGRGVDRTGLLSSSAMEAAEAALRDYGQRIRAAGAEQVMVIATSASRDAANAVEFLERVADVLGATPEVIPGEREAELSFLGATGGLDGVGRSLVIDPGGGSTEFATGFARPDAALSVNIGSVRLSDRLLPDRPADMSQLQDARRHVRDLFAEVPVPSDTHRVIGVAGTFTSLGAIQLGLAEYDRDRVDGSTMTLRELDTMVERLAPLSLEATVAIPSLHPKRAPVILAGAVIAAEAVRRTGIDSVQVSESDLLEGMILELTAA